jgi:hypothetical protein
VTLRVHELCAGARVTVSIPTLNGEVGASFTITHDGGEIGIVRSGVPSAWRVLLVGQHAISTSAGVVTATPDGVLVDLAADVSLAHIALARES